MKDLEIYKDISKRTNGDIYIGVVGPVRTGKSTFIKNFMDKFVIPNIENDYKRDRAQDELPQSASGKTIMTTEPKFVPNESVEVNLENKVRFKARMVDCVGYLVEGAVGHMEGDNQRMVKTPWSQDEIPFVKAAEIGTKKVINDHSTIGIVVTTDGSITDIPRENYIEAEERVINELKQINKPYIVILNSVNPDSEETRKIKEEISLKYNSTVISMDIEKMKEEDFSRIFERALERATDNPGDFLVKGLLYDVDPSNVGMTYTWSFNQYKENIGKDDEHWDELEKSIVANLADDVQVGIMNDSVEMIIYKKIGE